MSATIVLPVYNGASTLKAVFEGLDQQTERKLIDLVVIVNDCSTDQSASIINDFKSSTLFKVEVINNIKNQGLAENYNIGIKRAKSKFVITMHQDILLPNKHSFSKILKPLLQYADSAASYPTLVHPKEVWLEYNFWQRAMFSRFLNRKVPLLSGKFDCFNRKFLEDIGMFDSATFRTAGEDGDLKRKFAQKGYAMLQSDLEVIHVHNLEKGFSWQNYIKKEAQIAEAQGVLLRLHGIQSLKNLLLAFFRQLMLIGLLIPYLRVFAAMVILCYATLYTWQTYRLTEIVNSLKLYTINILLLLVATIYSLRGFITKRQTL